ncbi:ribonuclease H family protein [Acidicapsa ligni]|uniref:ribonuclease H family protein n=1 Tax=Acidicapsa ligni TaxID=542300 RepID=UPI0021DF46B2|nr:ribonuclease H [Acidicapsa ligni]
MDNLVRIFTDGSAIGNPGPGGWAAVLICGRKRWEMSGGIVWTTSSEMELVAAIQPLRSLACGTRIELRSDSQSLVRGMRFLVQRWQTQDWINRRGIPIQYRHHWEELSILNSRLHIQWRWLKGHNHHPIQCRADELAYRAAREHWNLQRKAA